MKELNELLTICTDLEGDVLEIILNNGDDTNSQIQFMHNVLEHRCQSGWVTELVWYSQTEEFFKNNMSDIFDLYNECFEGITPHFELNANNLTWFAFEYVCSQFIDELEGLKEI